MTGAAGAIARPIGAPHGAAPIPSRAATTRVASRRAAAAGGGPSHRAAGDEEDV